MFRQKMSIDFERNKTQVAYERIVGADPENLKAKKVEFENHELSFLETELLKNSLKVDSVDFFYNGLLSFAEGIDSAFNKRFSWATVKLYYSLYYLLRASLASKEIAILRCSELFRLVVKVGGQPIKKGGKGNNSTHEGIINHYRDMYKQDDILLTNNIEDKDVYRWMEDLRNIVNYRSVAFYEPDCLNVWEYFEQSINEGCFAEELKKMEEDSYIMCFQEEYAVVAIPIKRMQQTIADLMRAGLITYLSEERIEHVKSVLQYEERKLHIFSNLFAR